MAKRRPAIYIELGTELQIAPGTMGVDCVADAAEMMSEAHALLQLIGNAASTPNQPDEISDSTVLHASRAVRRHLLLARALLQASQQTLVPDSKRQSGGSSHA